MASLFITEFKGAGQGPSGGMSVPYGMIANQQVTIGLEADSVAFNIATRIVRLWAEAACFVTWGPPEQTATNTKMPLGAGESLWFTPDLADEISVIAP